MSFKDFLSFDKMIAGRATQLLYWLGIVAILLIAFLAGFVLDAQRLDGVV